MKTIKSPQPSKSHERQLAQAMDSMVELMSRLYQNQVLLSLQKSTLNKFSDAQVGNYAKIFLGLSAKAERSIRSRFDDKRIDSAVKQILNDVDARNASVFYGSAEEAIGMNPLNALATEGLNTTKNALILETSQWAKRLRDNTLEQYTANSLRAMSLGKSIDEIMGEYIGMVETQRSNAKFVARNQVSNYNSMVSKARAQKLGITEAIWKTSKDERVRKSHAARDGKTFTLSDGLYSSTDGKTLLPGTDYLCRCSYEMILPEE